MAYSYYAFISYSRKDKAAARYLQSRLENYRYPAMLVDEDYKPNHEKYLRKIFRDTSDLDVTQNNFSESIDRHITESRFLIVLCSPNSRESKWVDKEIVRFLETHDNNMQMVFPIILEGDVPDCLPERLRVPEFFNRNIPTMIPDNASTLKEGWEHGFLQLVSTLLNVSFVKITDRFQKAKQAMLRKIFLITLSVLLITTGLMIWALIAEHKARIAEAEARHEAEVAKQTLSFIENAFESADAMRSGNKNMTVLQFAKMSSERVHNNLMPEVHWKIFRIIAPLLYSMGDPVTAMQILEKAEPIVMQLYKKNDPEYADYLAMRGKAYGFNALYDRAKADLIQALAVRQNASDQLALADILYRTGKFKQSLELCTEARKKIENDKALQIFALSCAGKNHRALHELDQAFKNFSTAYRMNIEIFGGEHPQVAEKLNDMGNICLEQKHFEQALKYYLQALNICEKTLGKQHPQTARLYNNIGIAFRNLKKYNQALEYYQKSLKSKKALHGDNHPEIAQTYNNIAVLYQLEKNFDQACEYYQKALDIYNSKLGPDHIDSARVRVNLALAFRMLGKNTDALAHLLKADAVYSKVLARSDKDIAAVCFHIADIYSRQKIADKLALEYFYRALNVGKESDIFILSSIEIAKILIRQGRSSEAEKHLKAAHSVARSKYGPTHRFSQIPLKILKSIK